MFAVMFPDEQHKELFEELLGPALKLCGLRINIVHALEEREPVPSLQVLAVGVS